MYTLLFSGCLLACDFQAPAVLHSLGRNVPLGTSVTTKHMPMQYPLLSLIVLGIHSDFRQLFHVCMMQYHTQQLWYLAFPAHISVLNRIHNV